MSHGDSIINAFLKEPDQTLSGGEIARRLGISRTAVWKNIKNLQREGYKIEISPRKGYALKALTPRPLEREIKRGLQTKSFGRRVFYHEKIDSTNNTAKELARRGEEEGTVVLAEEQSIGRGRLDRSWDSPKGGIFMSLILRPEIHPAKINGLTLLFGLAVVKAIRILGNLEVELKWPNDIVFKDKKLGGILSEMEGEVERINFVVIGIGIDANCDASVDIPTTSLKKEIGREINIVELVKEILRQGEELYDRFKSGSKEFLREYKESSSTIGKDVKIVQPKRTLVGKTVDFDTDGALLLRLSDGSLEKVISGDCIHLRCCF
jgi:BirA family biotin operon repressor/biotin-[acetyl-CoA-carboxylase] ligase